MSMITKLVERLREQAELLRGKKYMTTYLDEAADTIEQLAAKARPKTGRWIYGRNSKYPNKDILSCSECGRFFFYIIGDSKPNYCSNCGAKMESGSSTDSTTDSTTDSSTGEWIPIAEPYKEGEE